MLSEPEADTMISGLGFPLDGGALADALRSHYVHQPSR
jgi:hypothetical protein